MKPYGASLLAGVGNENEGPGKGAKDAEGAKDVEGVKGRKPGVADGDGEGLCE